MLEKYWKIKEEFVAKMREEEWYKTFEIVSSIISRLWTKFSTMNGWELSAVQLKLAWYKYFLSEYVSEYQRLAEFHSMERKNYKAWMWQSVSDTIKARDGKVSNKEQIENEILLQTEEIQCNEILYENYYNNFKIKMSAMNDIITACTMRISALKRDLEYNG